MGTNALPRKKRRKASTRFRVLLALVIAVLVALVVPTTVAMASEDGGGDSTSTSQSATSDDSTTTTTTTTTTSTPTTAADPPDSSAGDQQEGGDSGDTDQQDAGGDDSTSVDSDQSQGDGDSGDSAGDQSGDSQSGSDQSDQSTQAADNSGSDSGDSGAGDSQADQSSPESQGDTQNGPSIQADLVPTTIAYSQSGTCPNFTVSGVLSGDIPEDMTLTLAVTYGIPGDGFPTGDSASFGPGLVAGQSYSVSFSTATIPSGADPGYGWFVDPSSSNQSAVLTSYAVNTSSCDQVPPVDSDGDGVDDGQDQCPNTPPGTTVDANGCPVVIPPVDSDSDGVSDTQDQCPNTPAGTTVDEHGCPVIVPPADSDGDGVSNDKDKCANTPAGASVDADGCADSQKDSDGDGKTDDVDKCPGTKPGFTVDDNGCIKCPEGTQPVYAEGNDGIVNDCRPVVTTPPTVPTTTSSGPTTTAQPTGSSNPPTDTGNPTGSPQPTGNPGGMTNNPPVNSGPTVVPVPASPAIYDPPGPGNATWVAPVNTGVLVWTLSADGRYLSVSVVDPTKFVFAEGHTHNYGLACDSEGEVQQVAPVTDDANPVPTHVGAGGDTAMVSTTGLGTVQVGLGLALVVGLVGLVVAFFRRRQGEH